MQSEEEIKMEKTCPLKTFRQMHIVDAWPAGGFIFAVQCRSVFYKLTLSAPGKLFPFLFTLGWELLQQFPFQGERKMW